MQFLHLFNLFNHVVHFLQTREQAIEYFKNLVYYEDHKSSKQRFLFENFFDRPPYSPYFLFFQFEASQIYILHIACYFLWVQNMTFKGTENRRPKRLHIMNKENIKIGLTAGLCRLPSLTYVLRTWHSPFNSQILSEQCTVPLILRYYLNNA